MVDKKVIVISAVNLVEGGTLTILRQCLEYLSDKLEISQDFKVIALVHDKNLCEYHNIEYVEFPSSKRRWINRLYFEYFYFNKLSKKLKPYLWLSLHDMTPSVNAKKRAVYCHNPTFSYKPQIKELKFGYKLWIFSMFYRFLYRVNIKKNDYVIVQQDWIRDSFMKMYKLKREKILVAYPKSKDMSLKISDRKSDRIVFFYPSLSRVFKNFEAICRAVELLGKKGINNYEVILTIDGSEDKYSRWICETFSYLDNIKFAGLMPYEKVVETYEKCSCLLFPSRLETWGLPISEFAVYDKPMIISDLPYAKETASSAKKVSFFDPMDAKSLADKMELVINNQLESFKECPKKEILSPFAQSWEEIFNILL